MRSYQNGRSNSSTRSRNSLPSHHSRTPIPTNNDLRNHSSRPPNLNGGRFHPGSFRNRNYPITCNLTGSHNRSNSVRFASRNGNQHYSNSRSPNRSNVLFASRNLKSSSRKRVDKRSIDLDSTLNVSLEMDSNTERKF